MEMTTLAMMDAGDFWGGVGTVLFFFLAFHYYYKNKQLDAQTKLQMKGGTPAEERLAALEAHNRALTERVEHLESLVTHPEHDLERKIKALQEETA